METISKGISKGNIQKWRFCSKTFLKRANFQGFSGIASSMKMLSKDLRVEHVCIYVNICVYIYIYIGGLMECISQKVAIYRLLTVCPCIYYCFSFPCLVVLLHKNQIIYLLRLCNTIEVILTYGFINCTQGHAQD